jgi:hypothetical protein
MAVGMKSRSASRKQLDDAAWSSALGQKVTVSQVRAAVALDRARPLLEWPCLGELGQLLIRIGDLLQRLSRGEIGQLIGSRQHIPRHLIC